jgi:hypothetical protein
MKRPHAGERIRWRSSVCADAARLEVQGTEGEKAGEHYTLVLATNGKTYEDGQEVLVE